MVPDPELLARQTYRGHIANSQQAPSNKNERAGRAHSPHSFSQPQAAGPKRPNGVLSPIYGRTSPLHLPIGPQCGDTATRNGGPYRTVQETSPIPSWTNLLWAIQNERVCCRERAGHTLVLVVRDTRCLLAALSFLLIQAQTRLFFFHLLAGASHSSN